MISQYIEVLILAFIQGFSEFIPVSSSGHLIIVSEITIEVLYENRENFWAGYKTN